MERVGWKKEKEEEWINILTWKIKKKLKKFLATTLEATSKKHL